LLIIFSTAFFVFTSEKSSVSAAEVVSDEEGFFSILRDFLRQKMELQHILNQTNLIPEFSKN